MILLTLNLILLQLQNMTYTLSNLSYLLKLVLQLIMWFLYIDMVSKDRVCLKMSFLIVLCFILHNAISSSYDLYSQSLLCLTDLFWSDLWIAKQCLKTPTMICESFLISLLYTLWTVKFGTWDFLSLCSDPLTEIMLFTLRFILSVGTIPSLTYVYPLI